MKIEITENFKNPIIGFVAGALFLICLEWSMVFLALPAIAKQFTITYELRWILVCYFLPWLGISFFLKPITQRYGRKLTALAGISIFVIGNLLCGTAFHFGQLAIYRIIEGLGSSLILFPLLAIYQQSEEPESSKHLPKILMGIGLFGGLIGFGLGGVFMEFWNWPFIFWVQIPLGLLLYYLCLWKLPNDEGKAEVSFQIKRNYIFLFTSVLFGIIGLSPFATLFGIPVIVFLGLGLLSIILWFVSERKPILSIFSSKKSAFISFVYTLIVTSCALLISFFSAKELQFGPLKIGLILWTLPLFMLFATWIKLKEKWSMILGLLFILIGLLLYLPLNPTWGFWDLIFRTILLGCGYGLLLGAHLSLKQDIKQTLLSFGRNLGLVFGPVLCTFVWSPNILDTLPNLPDMRIVLCMLIAFFLLTLPGFFKYTSETSIQKGHSLK